MAVTHRPWDGSASRFTDAQYQRSCLIDRGGTAPVKERCSLPVLEPNGDLNANALGPAAGALAGARGGLSNVTTAQKATAARKLIRYYGQAQMTPPDSLKALAGRSTDDHALPRENLFRAQRDIELVRSEDSTMPTLAGHFAVFDQWTEINSVFEGHFMERFAPGAFKKTISESKDRMRVLFNHGKDPQIGDKVLGPIRSLEEDTIGARYEVSLLDTSYNRDLIAGLEAGLYGSSFRFQVFQEEKVTKPRRSKDNPEGLPERTITEAQVKEFGPVTFPAYAGATAGLRSLTDEFLLGEFADNPERLLELVQALKERRETVVYEEDNRAESEPPEATTQTPEKPERSVATTPLATRRPIKVDLKTTRKEAPTWRL